jgi:hypothetical protein
MLAETEAERNRQLFEIPCQARWLFASCCIKTAHKSELDWSNYDGMEGRSELQVTSCILSLKEIYYVTQCQDQQRNT